LGRETILLLTTLRDLDQAEVTVCSLDNANLKNELTRTIESWKAGSEKKAITERTKRGKRGAKAAGRWVSGTIPYGYQRGPKMSLEQCPSEAPVLRRIYDLTIEGRGRIHIAKLLNGEGVHPPLAWATMPGKEKPVRLRIGPLGGWDGLKKWLEENDATLAHQPAWQEASISKLLAKEISYGELDGVVMDVRPVPIITKDIHDRALSASSGRNMKGAGVRETKLLTSILKCGSCGLHYAYTQGGADRDSQRRYRCSNRHGSGQCTSPSITASEAHAAVLEPVTQYLIERLQRCHFAGILMAAGKGELSAMKERLAATQRELTEAELEHKGLVDTSIRLVGLGVDDAALQGVANNINKTHARRMALQREAGHLTAELSRAEASWAFSEEEALEAAELASSALWLEGVPEEWQPDSRQVLLKLETKAVIHPDKRIEVTFEKSEGALLKVIRFLADHALQLQRTLTAEEARRIAERGEVEETTQSLELGQKLAKFLAAKADVESEPSSWSITTPRATQPPAAPTSR
jgi:hypothetical protein